MEASLVDKPVAASYASLLIDGILNLIALSLIPLRSGKTTYNHDTFLYLFHIGSKCQNFLIIKQEISCFDQEYLVKIAAN